jgi:TetR/AcrR family transcriptional regulator, transcriptional repressor for nem operon
MRATRRSLRLTVLDRSVQNIYFSTMARPKEFDRDVALRKAMLCFWKQGYQATSTEDIARAMGIGRQSMYDTFGDKHSVYLQALQLYRDEQGGQLRDALADTVSPLRAVEAVLLSIAAERPTDRARGCMLVNATTECAPHDSGVLGLVRANANSCEMAFERAVRAAQGLGQLPAGLDPKSAGRFLFATVQGLRVTAKAGASSESLRDVAQLALAGLGASS